MIELNEGQQECLKKLIQWWKNGDRQLFEISGAAGTGKTTIIKYLIDTLDDIDIDNVLFVALVGKAAMQMTKSGVMASTIHSAIYYPVEVDKVDENGKKNHVEMVEYKPFKPYRSVDMAYLREARKGFTTSEWLDVLLSAMEYDPDGFDSISQKLEFLTRLLIFVEPRLNVIELAPKGTGKSYVFGNLSKYGWLVSGGKVTRAKLFYDKQKQQNGIIKNHDYTAFDEIQTIVFQEPSEIQAALKSYLESGKTTIDNTEFSSECGLMLMGNIPLNEQRRPLSYRYFDSLPQNFRESALLDRFHCFIEGWYLPRINKSMIFKGWTINVEYFS